MTGGRRVIGVGNALRGDDGAGLVVARWIADADGAVDVRRCSGGAAELLDAWEGAAEVVIVDAARSGRPAGSVRRFDGAEALPRAAWPLGTHDAGVAEALALGAVLGRLPARLRIYTIEGVDFTLGKVGLTPAVASAVEAVAREILAGPDGTDAVGQAPAGRDAVDRVEVG